MISREYRTGANANGTLKVLPFQGFSFNLNPQRSTRDFQLMVQNQGNAPTAYRFSGSDDEQALTYQFGQDGVSLQPGQSGAIGLHVAPKIKPKVGTREMRSFSVIASPLDPTAAEVKTTGQLIVRPPIPVWLIPLVLLVTLCMCVGVAFGYTQVCGSLGSNLPLCPVNAKPVINVFSVTPAEIEKGGTVALSWDVSNADDVKLTAPVQETLPKSGVKTVNVDQSTNFTLIATNKVGGAVEKSITVKLKNSPPVVQNFTSDPQVVVSGQPGKVTLSWTVVGAANVSIEGAPGATGATGSIQIDPPNADKVYKLVATNEAGTVEQSITIGVSSAGCVMISGAEMREGPSDKYRVIDNLSAGMTVSPVSRNGTGEWLRVRANKEGWIPVSAVNCANVKILDVPTVSPADVPPEPTNTPTITPTPTNTPVPTETPKPPATPTVKPPVGPVATFVFQPPVLINPGLLNPGLIVTFVGSSIDDYVGNWVPEDANWNGVVVIKITKENATQLRVHGEGKCSPTNCNWGDVIVTFSAEPVVATFSNGRTLTISMESSTQLRAVKTGGGTTDDVKYKKQ